MGHEQCSMTFQDCQLTREDKLLSMLKVTGSFCKKERGKTIKHGTESEALSKKSLELTDVAKIKCNCFSVLIQRERRGDVGVSVCVRFILLHIINMEQCYRRNNLYTEKKSATCTYLSVFFFFPSDMSLCVRAYRGSWSGCPDDLWARGWGAVWRLGGCSAERALGRKVWMKWWRTDCCWSPAGSALEDGPGGAEQGGTSTTLIRPSQMMVVKFYT